MPNIVHLYRLSALEAGPLFDVAHYSVLVAICTKACIANAVLADNFNLPLILDAFRVYVQIAPLLARGYAFNIRNIVF
jgi:hypothetical protein